MTDNVDVSDHERIWLQPRCCADPHEGRMWCKDKIWPDGDCDIEAEPTAYVRADLYAAKERQLEETRALLREVVDDAPTNWIRWADSSGVSDNFGITLIVSVGTLRKVARLNEGVLPAQPNPPS